MFKKIFITCERLSLKLGQNIETVKLLLFLIKNEAPTFGNSSQMVMKNQWKIAILENCYKLTDSWDPEANWNKD